MSRRQREIERFVIKGLIAFGAVFVLASAVVAGIIIVQPPSHGTLTVTGNDIKYQPDAGYVGTDHFTYRHTGHIPTIVPQGQDTLVFDENHKEFQVPVTLIVNEDGTRELIFGAQQN